MSEHDEQVALFSWAAWNQSTYPELCLLFAIPNGAGVRHQVDRRGKAYSLEGMKLKAEGLKPGVPDIFLPVPRLGLHGLFIEMKATRGTVRAAQKEWHVALRNQGYFVSVCRGWTAARDEIIAYMEMKS